MEQSQFSKSRISGEYIKTIKTEGLPKERIAVVDKDGEELCSIFGPGTVKIIFTPRFKNINYTDDK